MSDVQRVRSARSAVRPDAEEDLAVRLAPDRVAEGDPPEWSGGAREFAAVYRDHSAAVFAIASRVATPALAPDITQEVFLRLWNEPSRFDPTRGTLRTFLLTLAHHAAVDHLRSDSARRAREERVGRRAAPSAPGAEDAVVEDDCDQRVRRALDSLDPPRRDAIIVAFFGQVTYQEAARVLGVAEGTVKSRIRAGLLELHAALRNLDLR